MDLLKRVRAAAEETVQRATLALEGDGPPITSTTSTTHASSNSNSSNSSISSTATNGNMTPHAANSSASSTNTPHAATPTRNVGAPTGKVSVDMVALKRATREELFAVVEQLDVRNRQLEERGQKLFDAFKKEKSAAADANARNLELAADLGEMRERAAKTSTTVAAVASVDDSQLVELTRKHSALQKRCAALQQQLDEAAAERALSQLTNSAPPPAPADDARVAELTRDLEERSSALVKANERADALASQAAKAVESHAAALEQQRAQVVAMTQERDKALAEFTKRVAVGDEQASAAAQAMTKARDELAASLAAVTKDRDEFAAQLSSERSQVAAVTKELSNERSQVATVTKARDEVAALLANERSQVATVTKARDEIAASLTSERSQITALTQERDTVRAELTKQVASLTKERDELRVSSSGATQTLTERVSALTQECEQLRKSASVEHAASAKRIGELERSTHALTQERDTLSERVAVCERVEKDTSAALTGANELVASLERERDKLLEQQAQSAKRETQVKAAHEQALQAANAAVASMKSQLTAEQSEATASLANRVGELQSELSKANDDAQQLQAAHDDAIAQLAATETATTELRSQLTKAKAFADELQSDKSQLIDKHNATTTELRAQLTKANALTNELQAAKAQLDDTHDATTTELRAQLAKANALADERRGELAVLETHLAEKNSLIETQSATLAEFAAKADAAQAEQLKSVGAAEAELIDLRAELASAHKELSTLRDEVTSALAARDVVVADLERMRADDASDQLRAEREAAVARATAAEEAVEVERATAAKQRAAAETALAAVRSGAEALKSDLEATRAEVRAAEQRARQAESAAATAAGNDSAALAALREQLRLAQARADEAGELSLTIERLAQTRTADAAKVAQGEAALRAARERVNELETELAVASSGTDSMRRDFATQEAKWREMLSRAKKSLAEKSDALTDAQAAKAAADEAVAAARRAADDAIKQAAERERDAIEKRDAALRDVALVQNALDAAQAVADERAGEHNEYRQRAQAALQRADDDNTRLVEQLRALESTRDEARSASAAHAQRDVEHGATLERLQHELESARTVAAAADDARRAAEAQRADAVGAIADAERRAQEELTHLRSRVQSGNELIEEQAKQLQQLQSQLAASEQSVAAAQRELDTVLASQHSVAAAPSESAAAASAMTADSTQSGAGGSMLHDIELIKTLQSDLDSAKLRTAELATANSELEHEQTLHLQQAKLLKERIRELERAEERAATVNLEYLKNVVDQVRRAVWPAERRRCHSTTRLVPVIATCLKFSPEERARVRQEQPASGSYVGWLASAASGVGSSLFAAAVRLRRDDDCDCDSDCDQQRQQVPPHRQRQQHKFGAGLNKETTCRRRFDNQRISLRSPRPGRAGLAKLLGGLGLGRVQGVVDVVLGRRRDGSLNSNDLATSAAGRLEQLDGARLGRRVEHALLDGAGGGLARAVGAGEDEDDFVVALVLVAHEVKLRLGERDLVAQLVDRAERLVGAQRDRLFGGVDAERDIVLAAGDERLERRLDASLGREGDAVHVGARAATSVDFAALELLLALNSPRVSGTAAAVCA
jgi:hypothetical protein